MSNLQEEIEDKSKEIRTDSYPMSIGEIVNMYISGEIDIHPEFQRFYRWSNIQKTRLIESILLHIPIPPIFVSQRKDGVWDVVDGLQRLSTILNFVGVLKDDRNTIIAPLTLEKTELLPSLNKKQFGNSDRVSENYFTETQRRYFKREKLSFTIIQKESDESSKYELFQRLNTGGSSLTEQEVRSCLIVMNDADAFKKIKEMANDENFKESTQLSDKNHDEQYDLELVTRFIVLRNIELECLKGVVDFGIFLNDKILEIVKNGVDWEAEKQIFVKTFSLLSQEVGINSFKRYDTDKGKFSGGFLVSAFEIVALGLGYNLEKYNNIAPNTLVNTIKEIWKKSFDEGIKWNGANAATRLLKTLKLGREGFANENTNVD